MGGREWQPSKRAIELIAALWRAYEQGDRWVRCTNGSTARLTGASLVWNGIAEQDENDPRRFRLAEGWLNLNGLTRRCTYLAGITYGQVLAVQEAIECS